MVQEALKKIVPVVVEGIPEEFIQTVHEVPDAAKDKSKRTSPHKGSIIVTIRMREGLCIQKKGLDYQRLKTLVEKREGLYTLLKRLDPPGHIDFGERYGRDRLTAACVCADQKLQYGYQVIREVLELGEDADFLSDEDGRIQPCVISPAR